MAKTITIPDLRPEWQMGDTHRITDPGEDCHYCRIDRDIPETLAALVETITDYYRDEHRTVHVTVTVDRVFQAGRTMPGPGMCYPVSLIPEEPECVEDEEGHDWERLEIMETEAYQCSHCACRVYHSSDGECRPITEYEVADDE